MPLSSSKPLLVKRRLLDTLSWAMFMAKFRFGHANAILRAHRDFRRMKGKYKRLPKEDIYFDLPGTERHIVFDSSYWVKEMTMKTEKPLILITNDDGYGARGIEALINFVKPFGDVWCVCPAEQHSGQSMAMTINDSLLVKRQDDLDGVPMFTVNGTPVDCVKMSLLNILPRRPDLVLAGINHGSNASVNVFLFGHYGSRARGVSGWSACHWLFAH